MYMQKSKGERMAHYGTPWKSGKGGGGGVSKGGIYAKELGAVGEVER